MYDDSRCLFLTLKDDVGETTRERVCVPHPVTG